VNLLPPDAAEVAITARGCASAAAPASGLTALQRVLLEALFPAMTGGWPIAHPLFVAPDLAVDPARGQEALENWFPAGWPRAW
jgi:hypothetical protein